MTEAVALRVGELPLDVERTRTNQSEVARFVQNHGTHGIVEQNQLVDSIGQPDLDLHFKLPLKENHPSINKLFSKPSNPSTSSTHKPLTKQPKIKQPNNQTIKQSNNQTL